MWEKIRLGHKIYFFYLDGGDVDVEDVGKGVFVVVVFEEEGVDWQVKGDDGIKNVGGSGTRVGGHRDRLELISLKDFG